MKHAITVVSAFVLTMTIGMLVWPHSTAQAQANCKDFQAIVQATLLTSTPIGNIPGLVGPQTWGGPVFGMLGSDLLAGALSGNDGDETWRPHMGAGKDGLYMICADYPGCTNTLTYAVPHSTFPAPPGQGGIVAYHGNTAKIVGGTGKYAGASGNLNVNGPAIAWPDNGSPIGVSGRWNATISGKVCGI